MLHTEFLYFLMTEDDRFYTMQNGSLIITGQPTPVKFVPKGWEKIQINRSLDQEYFGIKRDFSFPLEFVEDGAFILKTLFHAKGGVEAKCWLAIARAKYSFGTNLGVPILHESGRPIIIEGTLNTTLETEDIPEYSQYYTIIYKSSIDFTEYDHDGPTVKARILESGISKLLKANEAIKREIKFDSSDPLLRHNGIILHGGGKFLIVETEIRGDITTPDMVLVGQETKTATASLFGQNYVSPAGQVVNSVAIHWEEIVGGFIHTDFANTFHIEGELSAKFLNATANTFAPRVFLVTDQNRLLYEGIFDNLAHSISLDVELKDGETLFIAFEANPLVPGAPYGVALQQSELRVSYSSRKGITYIKMMSAWTLFQRLAAANGINKVVSKALKTTFKRIFITCGDAIRGLPNPVIKTCLKDFVVSLNVPCCLGLNVEGETLYLEEKKSFIDYSKAIDLGECSKPRNYPSKDWLFGSIKIGYPPQDYGDVNGREEFNNTLEFKTPVNSVDTILDLVSVYRTDCYGIEFLRGNFDGKETTDSDSDNDVFMVYAEEKATVVDGISAHNIDRELNAKVTNGLLDPETVFNLWFTPKSCLYHHGYFIRSLFYNQDNETLVFTVADKNKDLVLNTLTEGADVAIATLDAPIFRPVIIDFSAPIADDYWYIFKLGVPATLSTIIDGKTYRGFATDMTLFPASREVQGFLMLSDPANDLSALISYVG